jgi:hypothetical protein
MPCICKSCTGCFLNSPNRHANTPPHVNTALRHPRPCLCRNRFLLTITRRLASNIQLCVYYIHTQICIVLQGLRQYRYTGCDGALCACGFRHEMALQAHAIDLYAPGLDEFDDAEGTSVLLGAVFKVVVLVVGMKSVFGSITCKYMCICVRCSKALRQGRRQRPCGRRWGGIARRLRGGRHYLCLCRLR